MNPAGDAGGHVDAVHSIAEQWRAVAPELEVAPLLVWGRLQRLVALADVVLRVPIAAEGLAPGDFDVLAALRRLGEGAVVASGELAQAMLVTAGAATKRVDRLAAAGLVLRERSTADGRERHICLTPAGRHLTDALMVRHLADEAALLSPLEASERTELARLLAKLLVHIEGERA